MTSHFRIHAWHPQNSNRQLNVLHWGTCSLLIVCKLSFIVGVSSLPNNTPLVLYVRSFVFVACRTDLSYLKSQQGAANRGQGNCIGASSVSLRNVIVVLVFLLFACFSTSMSYKWYKVADLWHKKQGQEPDNIYQKKLNFKFWESLFEGFQRFSIFDR